MRRPLTSTVHAPHWPWSQPFFVPVSWRRSRRASSRVVRGSTWRSCDAPLILRVSGIVSAPVGTPGAAGGASAPTERARGANHCEAANAPPTAPDVARKSRRETCRRSAVSSGRGGMGSVGMAGSGRAEGNGASDADGGGRYIPPERTGGGGCGADDVRRTPNGAAQREHCPLGDILPRAGAADASIYRPAGDVWQTGAARVVYDEKLASPAGQRVAMRPPTGTMLYRLLFSPFAAVVLWYAAFTSALSPDRLMLFPTTDPVDSTGATRRFVPLGGGQVEVWTARSARCRAGVAPEAYILRFYGMVSRADSGVAEDARDWASPRAVEFWGVNYPGFGGSTGLANLADIAPAALAAADAPPAGGGHAADPRVRHEHRGPRRPCTSRRTGRWRASSCKIRRQSVRSCCGSSAGGICRLLAGPVAWHIPRRARQPDERPRGAGPGGVRAFGQGPHRRAAFPTAGGGCVRRQETPHSDAGGGTRRAHRRRRSRAVLPRGRLAAGESDAAERLAAARRRRPLMTLTRPSLRALSRKSLLTLAVCLGVLTYLFSPDRLLLFPTTDLLASVGGDAAFRSLRRRPARNLDGPLGPLPTRRAARCLLPAFSTATPTGPTRTWVSRRWNGPRRARSSSGA